MREAYEDEPFVHVSERPPSTKWTLGSNAVHLTARYDARTGRVLAIAALDNLVKGAAGQMIQCANLMLGLEESGGPDRSRSLAMSVTAARGFVAAGCHAGIKHRATTWRWSRPRTASRSPPSPSSPRTSSSRRR